jgi:hypothetical protein
MSDPSRPLSRGPTGVGPPCWPRTFCARAACARACVMLEGRRVHAARVNSSESAA